MKILEKIVLVLSFIGVLCGFSILFCYFHINNDSVFQFGNKYYIEVLNNNLEPDLSEGDLALVESFPSEEYHINNIIAYYTSDNDGNMIIDIAKIEDGYTNKNSSSYIYTIKKNKELKEISNEDIIGKYTNKKIKNGVKISDLLINRVAFVITAVFPLILLFIIEFILLIIDYLKRNNSYTE